MERIHGRITGRLPRDSRGFSESDWSSSYARVLIPGSNGGYQKVSVQITAGDFLNGRGIIHDTPRSPHFRLGMEIRYAGGTASGVLPKYVSRVHTASKKEVILSEVADALRDGMQFKIKDKVRTPHRSRTFVPKRVMEREIGKN